MRVVVFHKESLDPREENNTMQRVAVVEAPCTDVDEALEYAYRYTNNINGSWSKGETIEWNGETHENPDYNENVEFVGEYPVGKDGTVYGARSTSVGDVMFADSSKYEVAGFGFRKVA